MMEKHEVLADGTCIPLIGPEKGLPHSFFSECEISEIFRKYEGVEKTLDDRGRWIITGKKHEE